MPTKSTSVLKPNISSIYRRNGEVGHARFLSAAAHLVLAELCHLHMTYIDRARDFKVDMVTAISQGWRGSTRAYLLVLPPSDQNWHYHIIDMHALLVVDEHLHCT